MPNSEVVVSAEVGIEGRDLLFAFGDEDTRHGLSRGQGRDGLCFAVVGFEENLDGEDEEHGCGEVTDCGESHQAIDAERFLPYATKQGCAS